MSHLRYAPDVVCHGQLRSQMVKMQCIRTWQASLCFTYEHIQGMTKGGNISCLKPMKQPSRLSIIQMDVSGRQFVYAL